ncbi:helical backbone metal receptor [Streptomyces sp. NPDC127068]|uniref:helical backbone metal receptor n=1 Tax=Streptomyces sp. NPDC127068 TaxID=3347127 RepID=UPI00365B3B95
MNSVRIVSLVPSLTEAVAVTLPGALVGATDWCTQPDGLDAVRIGGTKNPDVPRIIALGPDLVVTNEEENRARDIADLRAAGIEVVVTEIRSVQQAFRELDRVLRACGGDRRPGWLDLAESVWSGMPEPWERVTAVIPVWRRPWMVLGRDTFAGDVLARLGVDNVYANHPDRYPHVPLEELRESGAEIVVLPDEPYPFGTDDGPESFAMPAACVSGRHLTWYGPSMAQAPGMIGASLRGVLRAL